uniref:Uncharacterized protein n=1 Tax=Panagrolaimus sp. JU765 TaxID=591449 RepID=A0AC34RMK1_9BILA
MANCFVNFLVVLSFLNLADSYVWGPPASFQRNAWLSPQTPTFFNPRPTNGRPCGRYPASAFAAHQLASYCADLRRFQRAGYLIWRANITQDDVRNLTTLAENWDVPGIRSAIYDLANERLTGAEKNESLQLLDELGPPLSFTDALEVFTVEQKGQVLLLFRSRRYHDIAVVTNGLIASLPDEDQPKARRFIQAIHYLFL